MRRALPLLLAVAPLLAGVADAWAQTRAGRPLRAMGVQELRFGTLLAGVPTTVLPTDPLDAGQMEVRGRRFSEVLISLLLPGDLVGPGGATVPLTFGPGSGGYSPSSTIGSQLAFDPTVPTVFTLPGNGRSTIYLGGTAHPPPQPPPGTYSGSITLSVSYISN